MPKPPEPKSVRRALIVGGGIAGLATAAGLHRSGIECEVLERRDDWAPTGAGIVMSVNAMAVLRRLEIAEEVEAAGHVLGAGAITNERGEPLSTGDFRSIAADHGPTVAIHRVALHEALLGAAKDVPISFGTTIDAMTERPDGIEVTLTDGRTREVDLVIGADGIRSAVRQHSIGPVDIRYTGHTCWRMAVPIPTRSITQDIMWGPGMEFGIVPIGSDHLYCFAVVHAPYGQPDPLEGRLERFRETFGVFGGQVPEILSSLQTPDQLIHDDLEYLAPCDRYRGRTVLVGDAAHAMPPNMGQGAAMALEDSAVLVEELTRAGEAPISERLGKFAGRRARRVRWVRSRSQRIGKIGMIANPLLRGLRNALVRRMPVNPVEQALRKLAEEPI
ncbi:MAG: FAD-dependent monooxygenase [bacterium]|nr:FAD-dependent monooxygenase [bacterium]